VALLERPRPNRIIQIIGVLIMAASVAVIMFSGTSVITEDSTRSRLDQFAAHVYEHASKDGKEGVFSYGDIHVRGWGYSKYAEVSNVSLGIAERSLLDTTRWTFSTLRMDVLPDPVNHANVLFVFPAPINVIKNSQLKSVVSFSEPLKYGLFDGEENKTHTVKHTLYMPAQIILTPGRAVDSKLPPGQRLTISYDANPLVLFKTMPEKHEREAAYAFGHVHARSDDGSDVTIESLASNFSEKPGADGKPQGSYTLQISDLALHDAARTTKAYSFGFDISYRGDQPGLALSSLTPQAGNTEVTLNQLFLASDDFRVKAAGNFALSVDDPLPAGAVQIDIENVQQLLASELMSEPARKALVMALQKTTGKDASTLTNASLPMKRESKGVMYVGAITFDELAAGLLADMMKPPARPQAMPPVMKETK
jgi:hypothetical protein